MKYLKIYEKFTEPYTSLKIGDIYMTDKIWISGFMLDNEDTMKLSKKQKSHKEIIPLVKIVNIDTRKIESLTLKSFFIEDNKEYIFDLSKSDLIRKATLEEIEKFKEFEIKNDAKKYNL